MLGFGLKNQLTQQKKIINDQSSVLQALDKSNAVIEFTPTGEILSANDNFLKTVGYSLDEIVGKHHQIFVPQDVLESVEYQSFWQNLSQGQTYQQRFKRIDKQGQIVWLEASYNPVFENGQVVKVVKYATNITDTVNQELDIKAKMQAIDKAMAVIEFKPDGTILDANNNFCQAVGYSLDEIVGKHHRIFVDPGETNTTEYQNFWHKLAGGTFDVGQFKRIRKNGDEIWIEASYNPIFDANGQVNKVVKYATDITARVKEAQLLEKVVHDTSHVLKNISEGDLTHTIEEPWTANINSSHKEHLDLLFQSLNNMSAKLLDIVTKVSNASDIVSSATKEVSQGAVSLSQRVQEQAAALEQTSATMNQMNAAVQSSTESALKTVSVAQAVQNKVNEGASVMKQTIEAMTSIQESSHKIADIVTLIDGIAFQTNLLALNAAVEAARAGDHGRGFAVVAGEVRALAQKSAEAAKEIKQLIDESVTRINDGTQLASESGDMLQTIQDSINDVTVMINQIAKSSEEQSKGIKQVHNAISQIDGVTQQNAALVEETSAASESLDAQAQALQNDMAFFKTA